MSQHGEDQPVYASHTTEIVMGTVMQSNGKGAAQAKVEDYETMAEMRLPMQTLQAMPTSTPTSNTLATPNGLTMQTAGVPQTDKAQQAVTATDNQAEPSAAPAAPVAATVIGQSASSSIAPTDIAPDTDAKPVLLKISFKAGDTKPTEMPDSKVEDDATFAARPWQTTSSVIPFLMALRATFAEKFADVPDLGPQDIEDGLMQEPPSAEVQILMCRLLTLASNRSKTVDYPQYNRALSEVVDRLAPTRGDPAWQGLNPMPQGKKFIEIDWQDRLRLLHCLGEWALQESKYCRDLIEKHYAQKHRANPLAFDPIGKDDRKHTYYLFKGIDTFFRVFIQTDLLRQPSRWYAIASTIEELKALVEDLRATSCFTQRGKQLLRQLDTVVVPECERASAIRAKLLHNKERALREKHRKQAVAQRLMAQGADRELSRTRGKARVDYNSMLEGGRNQSEDDEAEGEDTPQRSFSGRLLKRKREELPEIVSTPSKVPGERSYAVGEAVDGGWFGGYDFDVRSAEQIAEEAAARDRLKLKLPFKRWSEILTKQQQRQKRKQEERAKLGKVKQPRAKSSPLATTNHAETVAAIPEGPPSRHILVIGSAGVDLDIKSIIQTLLPSAAQQCARIEQPVEGLDLWLHLPPAIVANTRGFFGRLQGMLAQLYLAASQALQRCQIDLGKCPVTVIIAGWAGYDLAREHIDWLYACCREEDRGLMARFATHSRHRIQYVQLLGATNGANGVQPPSPNTTPGGSYMGPLPPQMSSFAGVAAQGTFDHLHAGHKVLLTCAAILSTQTIYLGVLDDPAAHRLADPHAKYVQPLAERVHRVASFLARVRRRVALHVTPLAQQDSLGPIGTEVAVQALVVSKETEAMCGTVAAWRISHHLQLLSNYVVDVLGEMAVCVHAGDAADKIDWDKVQREKLASRKVRERLALEVSPTSSTMQGPAAKPSTEATSSQTSLPPPFQPIVQPQASSQPQVVQATGFVPSFQRIEQDTMTKDL